MLDSSETFFLGRGDDRAINDEGGGVSATLVNDGSDTNPFRLVLTANSAGEDNRVNIVENDTTLDFADKQIDIQIDLLNVLRSLTDKKKNQNIQWFRYVHISRSKELLLVEQS